MRWLRSFGWLAGLALCVVAVVELTQPGSATASHQGTGLDLPNHRLTPGAHVRAGSATICRQGYTGSTRKVTKLETTKAYARYGLKGVTHGYALDHLIPIGLAGSNSVTNLWPERLKTPWGARTKNRLETRLHTLVCMGKLTLSKAQRLLATNWVAAYKQILEPSGGGVTPATDRPSPTSPTTTTKPSLPTNPKTSTPPTTPKVPTTPTTPGTPTTPTPPPPARIYWGAYIDGAQYGFENPPWDMRTITTFQAHAGKNISILHFGQPWYDDGAQQAFDPVPMNDLRQIGVIPQVDWNSWNIGSSAPPASTFSLAHIIDGDFDSYIRTWATSARDWGHPFFLRFDHEMNGTWFSWDEGQNGNTAGQYVQAWRHVHDIFTAVGATNVSWVWCPNAEYPGSLPLEGLYPGANYVDWTCIDAYNFGTNPVKSDVWRSFATAIGPTYSHILTFAPAKPIMIGETASTEIGGSKSAWITAALASLPAQFPSVKAFLWFNWPVSGEDWPIESSASATAAFKTAIAASYFAPNQFGAITQSPIPPP
jgi:hypothetical protein